MLPRVLIGNDVVSQKVLSPTLQVNSLITKRIDTARFTLDGKPTLDGAARYPVEKVDEVIITDVLEQYLTLDGSDDEINCGHDSTLDIRNAITVETLVVPVLEQQGLIITKGGYNVGYQLAIEANGHAVFLIKDAFGSIAYRYSTVMSFSVKHHIVGTYDGTDQNGIHVYVDGVLADSSLAGSCSGAVEDRAASDLKFSGVSGRRFGGNLIEMRLYKDRVLSLAEIQANYNNGDSVAYPASMDGLVGWWTFDELSGTTVIDHSGNENHGTIVGGAARTIKRHFAGLVSNVDLDTLGLDIRADVSCQDYAVLLDGVLVNEVYDGKTSAYILNDLFSTYLPEIDASTHVATGITHSRLVFPRTTLREALDTLASEAECDWYIDYEKNLHFFTQETNAAPFGLSTSPDNSTTYPFGRHKHKSSAAALCNCVTVEGGFYYSDDTDFELAGNGQTTDVLLPYKLHAPSGETGILVYRNDGDDTTPNWTQLDVGIDNIDSLGDVDVLYNYQEKLLKFGTAPPNLDRAVKVTGRYEVPVLVRCRSLPSYEKYGRWFEERITDDIIDSREWATRRGKAHLADRAFQKESGTLVLTRDGLAAGQNVSLYDSLYGVDDSFLIHQVTMRALGGTNWAFTVKYGEYNPDLIDILIVLKRKANSPRTPVDNEVLTELLEQRETQEFTENTALREFDFSGGIVSAWLAQPTSESPGRHIQHERQDFSESTDITATYTEAYKWG